MSRIVTDKQRVIVGLGITGLSCARFFAKRGLPFVMLDSRDTPPMLDVFREEFPAVECVLGELNARLLADASELIVSPGVALDEPAIQYATQQGVPVKGDIDVFCEVVSKPIIAITGSNGKTTVTTLVGEMVREAGKRVAVAGNIGVPVLDVLDEQGQESAALDCYVLELSSFQLERLARLSAEVAVILNLSADHMDRYSDIHSYHAAKQRIFRGAKNVVVNRADKLTQPMLAQDTKRISFGLDEPEPGQFGLGHENGKGFLAEGCERLLCSEDLLLLGKHNIENALAALAIGRCAKLPMSAMLSALKKFTGLKHRCQYLGRINGIAFVNDSKGTNVGASVAAIEGLCSQADGKVVLIAGGEGKGADFSVLAKMIQRYARALVLLGKSAQEIATRVGSGIQIIFVDSMDAAVRKAFMMARSGDTVLLSPACASFDMFRNYEERGDAFIASFQQLQEESCQ